MIQFDDENIILCVNCDAEYSVNKYDDDEEQEAEFCPFCGYHIIEDDEEFDDEEEEEDDF